MRIGWEGAGPGGRDILDHDLIARLAAEGGEATGGDHLHPLLGLDGETGGNALPDHAVQDRFVILQVEIDMARAGARHAADLAPDADMAELALDHPLDGVGNLGNGKLGLVLAGNGIVDQVGHAASLVSLVRAP